MADVILVFIVALSGFALGWCGCVIWTLHHQPPPVPPVAVQASPAPPAPIAPVPGPVAVPPHKWRARFVTADGSLLCEVDQVGKRRPTMVYRTGDGSLGSFVASHCVGNTWVYRRVGIEREGGEKR